MTNRLKTSLIAGATVATVGLGLAGSSVALADTNGATGTSLVDKIATKFNLNKAEVQSVFDANRTEHMAQAQTNQADKLAQAVKDGKLTQAQADHIAAAQKDIQALMGTTKPGDQNTSVRTQIKEKMDALRTWAQENNVDLQYVGPGGHGMRGGHMRGGFGGPGGQDGGMPMSN